MKFIIKLFPEITIKSPSVRLRFIKVLSGNIRHVLQGQLFADQADRVSVVRHWDHIIVRCKDDSRHAALCEALQRIPGIHEILAAEETTFTDLADIFQQTLHCYQHTLANKSFCVRVRRRGTHDFNSMDVERYVGGGLNQHIASAKVKLTQPDITVHLEIDHDKLFLIKARYPGIGGFPVSTQEDVLSLISGGFDSAVASYMLIRRGCRVHYCFFNLGGTAHESGVRQMAHYLWQRYSGSHRVRFIAINFAEVVAEILQNVDSGQMGVVLKRMMIRAASLVAQRYGVQALVTGEALGQVSSQTLSNLRLIDSVAGTLILRPLIAHDKQQIIDIARQIGTETYSSAMPEYCAVISKSPTVKAIAHKIEAQEAHFDFSVLERAVASASNSDIRQLARQQVPAQADIETVNHVAPGEMVLDIRASDEQESQPLQIAGAQVIAMPFYKLDSQFAALDQSKTWLLWCERGVMSRLQALQLREQGFQNVKVYRP